MWEFFGVYTEHIVLALIVLILTVITDRVVNWFVTHTQKKLDGKLDKTRFSLLRHLLSGTIYIIGLGIAIYMIPPLRTLSVSMFAGAGVLAIVVGFAAQKAFANVISGIFIVLFKPFRVGDTIKFREHLGVIEDINMRHTTIRNYENKRFMVPNILISEDVIENFHIRDPKICRWVEFGISYDSDIDKAMKIMQTVARKHPNFIDNRTAEDKAKGIPDVVVRVVGFGDSSVNLRAWVWAATPERAFELGTDLNKSIKEQFDKAGIEIPFPYRTIVTKSPKKLKKR